MLHRDLPHGEVTRVPGDQARVRDQCGGSDQTVGLRQRYAASRVVPAPFACLDPLREAELEDRQPFDQRGSRRKLLWTKTANDLFDIDGGCARHISLRAVGAQSVDYRATSKDVD